MPIVSLFFLIGFTANLGAHMSIHSTKTESNWKHCRPHRWTQVCLKLFIVPRGKLLHANDCEIWSKTVFHNNHYDPRCIAFKGLPWTGRPAVISTRSGIIISIIIIIFIIVIKWLQRRNEMRREEKRRVTSTCSNCNPWISLFHQPLTAFVVQVQNMPPP